MSEKKTSLRWVTLPTCTWPFEHSREYDGDKGDAENTPPGRLRRIVPGRRSSAAKCSLEDMPDSPKEGKDPVVWALHAIAPCLWQAHRVMIVNSNGVVQAMMEAVRHSPHSGALHALRTELTDVRKYAVLNYIAVIKAVKKRNRHLGARLGAGSLKPLCALDLLNEQHFYTSPKLAALSTQAEILLQVGTSHGVPLCSAHPLGALVAFVLSMLGGCLPTYCITYGAYSQL